MPQTHSEEVRDIIVARVRDAPIRSKVEREILSVLIEQHCRSDPKGDRRIARIEQADAVRNELADMVTAGTPAVEAKETLACKYGHNSVAAFNKWLRRNRLRRRPLTSVR